MIPVYLGLAFVAVVLVALLRDDWRLVTRGRRVKGVVFDHRRTMDDGSYSYAPMMRFTGEAGETIEVADGVYSATPRPAVGEVVELVYPAGAPQNARMRRPLSRALVYAAIVSMLLILAGRALGWLPEGGDQGPAGL